MGGFGGPPVQLVGTLICVIMQRVLRSADASEAEIGELFASKVPNCKIREYVQVSKRREPGVTQAALVRMDGADGWSGHEAAMRAKKELNAAMFKGKKLAVRWSHTARVLWVSHLHESVTNEVRPHAHSCGHAQCIRSISSYSRAGQNSSLKLHAESTLLRNRCIDSCAADCLIPP